MSSVLISCVRQHPEGVLAYDSLEVDGRKVTLFLSRKPFFPKSGYLMINEGGKLEIKDVPEVPYADAKELFNKEVEQK